jgi:Dolichyl-phosphate-mannose-protein mannosyltransferase
MPTPNPPSLEPTLSSAGLRGGYERLAARVGEYPDPIAAALVGLGLCWRVWLAQATFFNTDEAWHYSVANQDSLLAAYKASLTLAHPPLMVFVLYFWRHLGTSDVMLRLPGVLAGTIFCWVFFKWLTVLFGPTVASCGLILAAFLPPMIALSAELRQYSWMLMFAFSAAYFLERALDGNSTRMMLLSSVCLYLAMLSHYSAFLFAASLGIYAILRMLAQRPVAGVRAYWGTGQAVGVGLAAILYLTHIAKLSAVYPVARPLDRFGDFYLSDWYFHPGRDRLLPFLDRGTFGVFRFTFGQTAVGQIAALLFIAGAAVLIRRGSSSSGRPPWLSAVLLLIPFGLNWVAVIAGLYPYGRTRQCIFLGVFGLAGVSFAISKIARNRAGPAAAIALGMVVICQAFGTLQGRDMLLLAEQRHEHMDQALQFIASNISPEDVILTDQATSFQLRHYLCRPGAMNVDRSAQGFEFFHCDDRRIVATAANDGALTAETLVAKRQDLRRIFGLNSEAVWVVQGGWASGLGEALHGRSPEFSELQIHPFGRYLEVFKLPPAASDPRRAR